MNAPAALRWPLAVFSVSAYRSQASAPASWPIPFKETSRSAPVVTLRLDPPDDPLPQVSAEITLLERARIRMEESLMAKLEDEFNAQLDNSQARISQVVEQAFLVFDDPDLLKKTTRRTVLSSKHHSPAFAQIHPTSFLQIEKRLRGGQMAAAGVEMPKQPPGTIKIQVTDIADPDPLVKSKMEELEQLRADEEAEIFQASLSELGVITDMFIKEVGDNLDRQTAPFLVDTETVVGAVEEALGEKTAGSEYFRQIDELGEQLLQSQCAQLRKTHPEHHFECPSLLDGKKDARHSAETPEDTAETLQDTAETLQDTAETLEKSSFLQTGMNPLDAFTSNSPKQMNVKIAQSDKPYPTVTEHVAAMERRRDATEKLERIKILQMELKLMKAQDDMLREILHAAASRVLVQYGETAASIRANMLQGTLAKPGE